jgi:TonB family protein
MLYHPAMRALPLALLLACAETSPRPEIITDCPAARDAEKALAAKEGRRAIPIIQKGRLVTSIYDEQNRPSVTPAMLAMTKGAPLKVQARIHVGSDGKVERVELLKSSGVPSFDEALVEKMKTWVHLPYVIDCRPFPYIYPMNYEHRTAR